MPKDARFPAMMAAVAYADENSNYRDPHAWVAEAKAAIALIAALEEKVARLTKERDEALRVRDLAREASNRDLEAKRQAEDALKRLRQDFHINSR